MPPRAALIILNPIAGVGRAAHLLPHLREAAQRVGARLVVTRRAGEAEELAAEAAAKGHDHVVAVGGDGTVQEVVNGITADGPSRVVLGVIPAGAGNDLARALHLPTQPMAALDAALHGAPLRIDVAEATDGAGRRRRFSTVGGTGFDAQVAHTMAGRRALWQRGRLGYLFSTLAELRRYRNARLQLSWEDAGGGRESALLAALMVAFANGAYYGNGMRIAPDARPDDGHLDLCIVGDISRLEALKQLPGIYAGRHVTHWAVRMARAARLRIEGDSAPVHLDGEPFGHLPIAVEVRPGAIEVAGGRLDGPDPTASARVGDR